MTTTPTVDLDHYKHSWYFVPSAIKNSTGSYENVLRIHGSHFNIHPEATDKINSGTYTYVNQLEQVIPCSDGLYRFITELKKHMPDLDFLIPKYSMMSPDGAVVVSLIAYRPGDTFALGEVGQYDPAGELKKRWDSMYGSYVVGGKELSGTAYVVCSPFIGNTRYRETSRGAFFKTAKNIETAVSNAKKYLRSYSPLDTGYVLRKVFVRKIRETFAPFSNQVKEVYNQFKWQDGLIDKMVKSLHAIQTGQSDVIMDSEVAELVTKYEDAKRKLVEASGRAIRTKFVMVNRANAVTVTPFITAEVGTEHMRATGETVVYQVASEVPEELQGATAMLNMVNTGEYVEGVGMRVSDRAYWVEV